MADNPNMSDTNNTPLSATSTSGPQIDNYRVVRRRNRIPLSCGPCRHRKLKCNRQSPCDNCIKRGDGASCGYAVPPTKRKGTSNSTGSSATPDDMQNRIDRLEGLVLSLMTNGSSAPGAGAANAVISAASSSIDSGSLGPSLDSTLDDSTMLEDQTPNNEPESETDGVTKSLGILKVDHERQKTFYVGEAHWAALINEISEVKNYFANHKKEFEAQMEKIAQTRARAGADTGPGPALLFGATIPPPRNEILSHLPSRYMSDVLVGRYFNSYDPSTHILHGPTFQRQYQAHWADPSKTSIVWIGMLFAIMRLAMLSFAREGDEPLEFRGKCQDMATTFRTQMAHCLITADYTKPHAFIIETLIFHLHAEYSSNRDTEASVWLLMGIIVRLAMRMGYHRDSKFFPDVTPFQGEMRRRVWSFVRTGDLLFSFQIALPPMVRLGDSDTDLPRNIYDDEFDETSTSLPPPRPQNEATPISYIIAKSKLSFGFGRVLEEINAVQRKSYDDVLKIDKALREIYDSVPEHLRVRSMSDQTLVPMTLIAARFGLATIYHKALCVLHRRFVRLGKPANRYMYSRKTCLESALTLLEFQTIQYRHVQERNRMRSLRNHVSSLIAHDYLLAGTLVCMDLCMAREREREKINMNGGDNSSNDASTPSTNGSAATPQSSNSGGSRASVSSNNDSGGGAYIPGLSYSREDVIAALERSRDIWMSQRDYSMEAYKASELLNVLLYHLKAPASPSQQNAHQTPSEQPGAGQGTNIDEQSAAMTLGMLQAGGMTGGIMGMGGMGMSSAQAAQMAQQAQNQLGAFPGGNMMWGDKNMMNNNLFDQGGVMFGAPVPTPGIMQDMNMNDGSSIFGAGNGMFPPSIFGTNNGGTGSGSSGMNIDWEAWDQYMQPTNISLDPMASLWSSDASPNNSNNYFQSQASASPDQNNSNTNSGKSQSQSQPDAKFSTSMTHVLFPNSQLQPGQANQGAGPNGNRNQSENNGSGTRAGGAAGAGAEGDAGDTFMGASTPGPGGVGIGGWKWTVMDPK